MSGRRALSNPSFRGLRPASERATLAARGSSKKSDTRCEVALRKALWARGGRYRKNVKGLPGCPDIVFLGARLAIFCDGDFWHGRDWEARRQKLGRGANSAYWIAKIAGNLERDWRNTQELLDRGWTVLHIWESDVRSDPEGVADGVVAILRGKRSRSRPGASGLDSCEKVA